MIRRCHGLKREDFRRRKTYEALGFGAKTLARNYVSQKVLALDFGKELAIETYRRQLGVKRRAKMTASSRGSRAAASLISECQLESE